MANVDPDRLPSVAEAKRIQRDRSANRDSGPVPVAAEAKQAQHAGRDRHPAQATDQTQSAGLEDENKPKPGGTDKEWSNRAGMVEQQSSAMKWVKAQDKAARTEQTDRKQERRSGEEARAEKRQALLREFGKDIENEQEADFERGRDRTR
jgi:hypothetical protein